MVSLQDVKKSIVPARKNAAQGELIAQEAQRAWAGEWLLWVILRSFVL